MNAIELGKFLASLRNEKKLTQEELAEKLFIDKRKISRWECGMSIPDFDTLIELSKILDVTLYELSICKRIEKEKLTKKVINKFKSIKDFKKYKLKRKIFTILSILLGVFFILTTIYTFKYYGKVAIYEFNSLDENYTLKGTYIRIENYLMYSINNISINKNNEELIKDLNDCKFDIYHDNFRLLSFNDEKEGKIQKDNNSKLFYYGKLFIKKYLDKNLTLKITCSNINKQHMEYSIDFEFIKKYDNKLF